MPQPDLIITAGQDHLGSFVRALGICFRVSIRCPRFEILYSMLPAAITSVWWTCSRPDNIEPNSEAVQRIIKEAVQLANQQDLGIRGFAGLIHILHSEA